MEQFSQTWKKRKVKLLGRIIRAHRYDPLRQVIYQKGTLVPRIEYKRRVGTPKLHWLKETYIDAWRLTFDEDSPLTFNTNLQWHPDIIHQKASDRVGIFEQRKT
jgi:hypothetical protein